MIDVNLINGIALAFEGDAVYSMYIRRHLIFQGMTKPNKLHQAAKNADVVTYRMSTGFEAVMGYLHMTGELYRIEELIDWCIQQVEEGRKQ